MKYKFRGKRIDNGEWTYGYLVVDQKGKHRIYQQAFEGSQSMTYFFVIPETVGMWTGKIDSKGTEIYEDDKLVDSEMEPNEYYLISWDEELAKFSVDFYGYNMHYNEGGGEEYSNVLDLIEADFIELDQIKDLEVIDSIHS